MGLIGNLIDLTRARAWIFGLQYLVMLSIVYLISLENPLRHAEVFIIVLIYGIFLMSYGCMINSLSDKKIDKECNKDGGLGRFSKRTEIIFLALLGIAVVSLPFLFGFYTRIIGAATFLIATFYSVKPFRLKTRGIWGLFAATLSCSTFPMLFLVSIIRENAAFAVLLIIIVTLEHFLREVAHQIDDYENDVKTKTRTWAVKHGEKAGVVLLKASLFLFAVSLLGLLVFPHGAFYFAIMGLFSLHLVAYVASLF